MKKFQSKPYPLFNQLAALYEGSCATGEWNFTSTQQLVCPQDEAFTSTQQQAHTQDEAFASIQQQGHPRDEAFTSILEGQAISGSHERTPASSYHREDSNGRKRKQSQIASVLEEYLEFKRTQSNIIVDEINQPAKESNKDEYSIGKCIVILESMEDLSEEEMAKALGIFK